MNYKNGKWGQTRYEFIAEADPGGVKSVLSMGCSYGWELGHFYNTAETLAGIDVNEEALEKARLQYPRCRFDYGSVTQVPYPDNAFDLVILSEVIEHVGDMNKPKVIAEAHRVLKPGGTFILTAPHAGVFAWADVNDWKRRCKPLYKLFMWVTAYQPQTALEIGHKHLSLREIEALFLGKFQIIKIRYCGLIEPFIGLVLLVVQILRLRVSHLERLWARESGVAVRPWLANNIRLVASKTTISDEPLQNPIAGNIATTE